MKLYTLALLLSLLLTACEDDDFTPIVPNNPISEEQRTENTFSCLINGEFWENGGGTVVNQDLNAGYWVDSARMIVNAFNRTNSWYEVLSFRFRETDRSIDLPITRPILNNFVGFEGFNTPSEYSGKYFLIDTSFNEVTVNHWTPYVIKGKFQCLMRHETTDQILKVEEGSFDVPYYLFD